MHFEISTTIYFLNWTEQQNEQIFNFDVILFSESIAANLLWKYFPFQDFSNVPRIKFFRKRFLGFCLGNRLNSLSFWETVSFSITRNFAFITFGAISDIKRYKTEGLNSVNLILVDALLKLNICQAFT